VLFWVRETSALAKLANLNSSLREREQQLTDLNYSVIDIWRSPRSVTSSVLHLSSYKKFRNLSKSSEGLTPGVTFLPL
jgi:hypothetical protein